MSPVPVKVFCNKTKVSIDAPRWSGRAWFKSEQRFPSGRRSPSHKQRSLPGGFRTFVGSSNDHRGPTAALQTSFLFTVTQTPENIVPGRKDLFWCLVSGGLACYSREGMAGKEWWGTCGGAELCGCWPGSRARDVPLRLILSPSHCVASWDPSHDAALPTFRVGLSLKTNESSLDAPYRYTQRSILVSLVQTQSSWQQRLATAVPLFHCLSGKGLTGTLLSHQPSSPSSSFPLLSPITSPLLTSQL